MIISQPQTSYNLLVVIVRFEQLLLKCVFGHGVLVGCWLPINLHIKNVIAVTNFHYLHKAVLCFLPKNLDFFHFFIFSHWFNRPYFGDWTYGFTLSFITFLLFVVLGFVDGLVGVPSYEFQVFQVLSAIFIECLVLDGRFLIE